MANDYAHLKRQTNATVGVYVATLDHLGTTLPQSDSVSRIRAAVRRRELIDAEQWFLARLLEAETFLKEYGCDPEEGDYDV